MSDSLATYLDDHLAGANFAVELLESLQDKHIGGLGEIEALRSEIEDDRAVLQSIVERAGGGTPILKEAAGWLAEKFSKLKLGEDAFGTFEALEALALGILGKLAMWQALEAITDARLRGIDFTKFIERAQDQHARAEELRLDAALRAFATARDDSDSDDDPPPDLQAGVGELIPG